jgi:hypothetical protein
MVAVNIVASGGIAVTESANGIPMTPTLYPGLAVTIVESGGIAVSFLDESGVAASPVQWSDNDDVEWSDGDAMQWAS